MAPVRKLRTTALDLLPETIELFWSYVREQPSGCWEWMGARSGKGYGSTSLDGITRACHRVAYELKRGPIPAGLMVCHQCDNPPCCNPNHLFLGTASDNIGDRMRKGRSRRVTVASYVPHVCANGHELTIENSRLDQLGQFIGCFKCYKKGLNDMPATAIVSEAA